MAQTLLQLCTSFSKRTGLPVQNSTATSASYGQLVALLGEVLDEIVSSFNLQSLTSEAVFSATGVTLQGPMGTIAPGFERLLAKTFFNRTRRVEVPGPLSPTEYQAQRTMPGTGPISWFRIVGDKLYLDPPPAAGEQFAFEYIDRNAVVEAGGATKQYPTQDTDTFRVPDAILIAGLRWKWKYEKGLEYAEDFSSFQTLCKNHSNSSNTLRAHSLDGGQLDASPGIIVPTGTWITPS
jgi:hypothetical protein